MKTPDGGETGEHLSIAYAGFYQVDYDFDQEKELYFRKINHADHPTWSGEKLSAANIIVIRVTNVDLKDGENKGRQDLYDTGTGTGWYLTEGKVYEITWEKATRTSHSIYAYKDTGEEIVLNPGVTWVQVVGNSIAVDIK